MNGCNCTVTRNYVTYGFLPAHHVDHSVRSVLRAVFYFCRTWDSERRFHAAAFGFALSVFDVDHPVRGVLRTIFRLFCTCHSERRPRTARFGFTLFAADADHSV